MADAARADEAIGARRRARRAARPAGRAQGSRRHRRHPHDARLAVLSRPRADARRADRHAHARGRRDHVRQDQHAGVRRRLADVQHRLRRDAQSLRPRRRPAAAAAAAPRWRSPAAWCRSPTAATPAARSATRPRSATSSGFRPSPGRVPRDTASWSPLSVSGPMARSVADVALFLSAIAGPDPRSPLSIREDGGAVSRAARADFKGVRVAWWTGSRRHSVRARRFARVVDAQPSGLRGARLRRRGGRAGLHRRRRGVSDAALRRATTRSTRRSSASGPSG